MAPVGTSMRRWTHALAEEATRPARVDEVNLWRDLLAVDDPRLGVRDLDPDVDVADTLERVKIEIPVEVTDAVLRTLPERYRGGVNDGLIAALAMAVTKWRRDRGFDSTATLVRLEGHGREEELIPGADLSRTVGWFTSLYPVRAELAGIDLDDAFQGGAAAGAVIKAVKEQLVAIPDRGMGYGLLSQLHPETAAQLAELPTGQISFNYLGRVGSTEVPAELADIGWGLTAELGAVSSELTSTIPAHSVLDINAIVGAEGSLGAAFAYPRNVIDRADVQEVADLWGAALRALAVHSAAPDAGGLTPSDLPLVRVAQRDIDSWESQYLHVTDVWPLAPLQSGLLFHAMFTDAAVDVYTMQATLHLGGYLDSERLRSAAQALMERYTNLRTAFTTDSAGNAVQIVLSKVDVPWREVDLSGVPADDRAAEARRVLLHDQEDGFDMSRPPLVRFTLVRTAHDAWQLGVTAHHILLDGWSMPLLMRDLLVLYAVSGDLSVLPRVREYRNFLVWLAERDRQRSLDAWERALGGLDGPTLLASTGRRAGDTTGIGKVIAQLSEADTARLADTAARLGVTVNTMVQAAWAILLGRMTGRTDVVFGATVSGRPGDLVGVESMVGLFINTVPVRVAVDPDASTAAVLQRLQAEQADLLEHHYIGLTDIQRAAGVGTLFDNLLVFESYPVDRAALGEAGSALDGLRVTDVDVNDGSHYPLTVLASVEETLEFVLKHDRGSFDTAEVQQFADRLVRILDALVGASDGRVGDIELVDAAELDALGAAGSGSVSVLSVSALLPARLAEVVEADPTAPALVNGDTELSYAELDQRSSRLARELIDLGAEPGAVVAIVLPRSLDSVVATWAVIKTGAAVQLVDPTQAAEPAADVTGAALVVTTGEFDGRTDGIAVLRLDDPDTARSIAARQAGPLGYAQRRGALAGHHAAIVVGDRAVTQSELAGMLARAEQTYGLDVESRTFLYRGDERFQT
ncbi:MAG: AMP-binding protein, partial [Aldersonia sp.]|nr:AMP-binding protein [Aldersonia sp.]